MSPTQRINQGRIGMAPEGRPQRFALGIGMRNGCEDSGKAASAHRGSAGNAAKERKGIVT
jgi:hypothetical protein